MPDTKKSKGRLGLVEALTLEELFSDQLHFKVDAILSLKTFGKGKRKELSSFLQELDELTLENIQALKAYANRE